MDVKGRKEFAKTKGLCFGCLGRGHLSRECKKRKKCGTCGKFHLTSLHGDYKNVPKETKQEEANTPLAEQIVHCTKSSDENSESQAQISSMIVPVWLRRERGNETYAQLTNLGWGIVGNVDESYRGEDVEGVVHRTVTRVPESSKGGCTFAIKRTVKELINPQQVRQMMELDFSEGGKPMQPLSIDDRKFLKQLQEGVHQTNNMHYEMPLPLRESLPELPNNKLQAMRRLERLKCRLKKDEKYRRHYFSVMNELIKRGYVERVPEHELSNESETAWYIPHHGIYHPQKPDKLRVVFDCSASYHSESLNNQLLQGPDLTNGLLGVLCRF